MQGPNGMAGYLNAREAMAHVVDQLQSFRRERLARFEVQRRIQMVYALPLTSVRKVDKARLRALATPDQTS